jgi:hypothetical protein
MTTANDVLATHWKYPHLCAAEIAIHLNCGSAYVRSALQRRRVVVPSKFARRQAERIETPKPFKKVKAAGT